MYRQTNSIFDVVLTECKITNNLLNQPAESCISNCLPSMPSQYQLVMSVSARVSNWTELHC